MRVRFPRYASNRKVSHRGSEVGLPTIIYDPGREVFMAQVKERRLLVAFMAIVLAVAGFMAFTVQSAWADDETIDVTFAVIGPDADGNDTYYVDFTTTTMPADSTAWDLSKKLFDENEIEYDYSPDTGYGVFLNSITSPITGEVLGWDDDIQFFWALKVNAAHSDLGSSLVNLSDGDSIVWRYELYTYPGPALDKTKSMYRIYNPNSGEHFYTMSTDEKDNLVNLGWNDEGIGWTAPLASTAPVYRLYNANGGEHHYTMDKDERDELVSLGWNDEGIGWYSDANESVKLYREYNPNAFANNHNYTTSADEHEHLLSLGWKNEDTAWYGVAAEE